jgi:hypothetical protein
LPVAVAAVAVAANRELRQQAVVVGKPEEALPILQQPVPEEGQVLIL